MLLTKRLATGRIFYGWFIVAAGFIGLAFSIGMQQYTYSLFFDPMNRELGFGRAELSGVASLATIVNGILAPFIGPLVDKHGGRVFMVVGAVGTGVLTMSVSLVNELWQLYLLRGAAVTLGMLFFGNLVITVAVANWFVRKRGAATGITAMGISFGATILTPLTQAAISSFGWRETWVILGVLVILFVVPPSLLLMSRRPEDVGLMPDGDKPSTGRPASGIAGAKQSVQSDGSTELVWERRQAMRTSTLWFVIASFAVAGLGFGAMIIHLFPFLTDKGISPQVAALGMSVFAISGFVSKPIWGAAMDAVGAKLMSNIDYVTLGLGLALLLVFQDIIMVYVGICVFGFGVGGFMITHEVVWADFFGRLTLGSIKGIAYPITTGTGALGPIIAGLVYDINKSYDLALIVFIAAYVLAIILLLLAKRPVHPSLRQSKT